MKDMPTALRQIIVTDDGTATGGLYYKITVSMDTSVGNEYQNQYLRADFRWWIREREEGELPGSDGGSKVIRLVGAPAETTAEASAEPTKDTSAEPTKDASTKPTTVAPTETNPEDSTKTTGSTNAGTPGGTSKPTSGSQETKPSDSSQEVEPSDSSQEAQPSGGLQETEASKSSGSSKKKKKSSDDSEPSTASNEVKVPAIVNTGDTSQIVKWLCVGVGALFIALISMLILAKCLKEDKDEKKT
jgi:hypothetical protein